MKKTIGEWFKTKNITLVSPQQPPSLLTPNNGASQQSPHSQHLAEKQIIPTSNNDKTLKASFNVLYKHVKSWYIDLKQQLSVEFAATHPGLPWQWTLEATRRAWPTCVRFMTRAKMLELCGWKEPRDMALTLLRSYGVTQEEIKYVATQMPQRSPEWYAVREGFVLLDQGIYRGVLISSSTVGEWLGDKYTFKADKGLKVHNQALYGKKYDDEDVQMAILTQRGTAMEGMIMEQAVLALLNLIRKVYGDFTVIIQATEVGLEVCYEEPNIGVSSDGRVSITIPDLKITYHFGLEMKCRGDPWMEPYVEIKPEYFDQIQLTMHVQKLPRYLFTCHSAMGFTFEVYQLQRAWWPEQLRLLRRRYWGAYYPTFVMKAHNLLAPGDFLPVYGHYASGADHRGVTSDIKPETAQYLRTKFGIETELATLKITPSGGDIGTAAVANSNKRVAADAIPYYEEDDGIDYSSIM